MCPVKKKLIYFCALALISEDDYLTETPGGTWKGLKPILVTKVPLHFGHESLPPAWFLNYNKLVNDTKKRSLPSICNVPPFGKLS